MIDAVKRAPFQRSFLTLAGPGLAPMAVALPAGRRLFDHLPSA
jgi:hypothetical protein